MPVFVVQFIAFSEVTPTPSTTETVAQTGTFAVALDAVPVTIRIEDDDPNFDDGFVDPNPTGVASTANNNQLLEVPVTVNGATFPAGSQVELEFAFNTADQNFFILRIDGVNVGITGDVLPEPGQVLEIIGNEDGQSISFDDIICFTAGTRIATPDGEKDINTLVAGDLVCTLDGPPQPVRWIGKRYISDVELRLKPHFRPVRMAPNTFGNNRALSVSPQHRMHLRSWRAELLFGTSDVLVTAKALIDDHNILQVIPEHGVHYVHLLFDQHQIIFAEGSPSESFHPGIGALGGIDAAAREEIFELFPELRLETATYGGPICRVLKLFEARLLLSKPDHWNNGVNTADYRNLNVLEKAS